MSNSHYAEQIRTNYASATVYVRGRKVMDKGKVLDFKWWKKKLRHSGKSKEPEELSPEAILH